MPHCLLDDLGTLRFRGADARKFLQGQISNDAGRVSSTVLLRAGLHNPQGRTLALLALLATEAADVLAFLPRGLTASVAALLQRFVLRSRVSISDVTAHYRIYGLQSGDAASAGAGQVCGYGLQNDSRRLLLQAAEQEPLPATMTPDRWLALDIAAGLPSISSELSGQFVAQMLNLDCIDAVSFNKGCYTGQEVIARAHYRGRVKRRMQRFETRTSATLTAGAAGRLTDGRAFRVVNSVTRADGHCEFLAVAPLPNASVEPEDVGGAQDTALAVSALPLPYALPE